jgi:hypothetical protein
VAYESRSYFRVVEQSDGSWACRRGRHALDDHPTFCGAITHIIEIAAEHPPSEVFAHYADGGVRSQAIFD